MGTLIVKRNKDRRGALANYNIIIDGKIIGQVANGEEKSFEISDGTHQICAENDLLSTGKSSVITINSTEAATITILVQTSIYTLSGIKLKLISDTNNSNNIEYEKKSILTGIIIFGFIALFICVHMVIQEKNKNELKTYTQKTEAKITKYYSYKKGRGYGTRYYYEMEIQYKTNGTTYKIENIYKCPDKYNLKEGDFIYVLYKQNQPNEMIPEFIQVSQIKNSSNWQKINTFQLIGFGILIVIYYKRNGYEVKY